VAAFAVVLAITGPRLLDLARIDVLLVDPPPAGLTRRRYTSGPVVAEDDICVPAHRL
jgi:hypothetical protein